MQMGRHAHMHRFVQVSLRQFLFPPPVFVVCVQFAQRWLAVMLLLRLFPLCFGKFAGFQWNRLVEVEESSSGSGCCPRG